MGPRPASNITKLLVDWKDGDKQALNALTPLLYDELHRLAGHYLSRERSDHTLQPTALIHEAYVRMVDQSMPAFQNRAHFFGIAAQIMRQVLVDFARKHRSAKRGNGQKTVLDEAMLVTSDAYSDLLELDCALEKLAAFDERKCRVIELRYFGGLSLEETAEALGLTVPTMRRDLALGKAWLARELGRAGAAGIE
jgi:RNA polymerase sigma-70 factor, ECF subfamily